MKTDTLYDGCLDITYEREIEKDDEITLQLFFTNECMIQKWVQAISGQEQMTRTSGWNYWRRGFQKRIQDRHEQEEVKSQEREIRVLRRRIKREKLITI